MLSTYEWFMHHPCTDYSLFRLLGEEKLFSVYRVVSDMETEEDREMEEGWLAIRDILGRGRERVVDRVIQLVVADTHYVLSN